VDGDWPLAGRDAEVALVARGLGSGRGIVIAGTAGVGKTRLAREVIASLDGEDNSIEVVAATRATAGIPLGVFAHLDEGRATGFVTPLGAVRHALMERAGTRRLVLFVDDAHALDVASAALVHQLAVTGDALLVATVRSGEAAPDAVVAMWKDGLCERLDLQPLSDRETGPLLERALEGPVDARTRRDLWQVTQGNLLFLREIVAEGLATGALRLRDGRWRWSGELHAPARVAELIATQLANLDDDVRNALQLVALGEPLEWDLLCGLAPGAEAAVGHGLLTVERVDNRMHVRLWHPLTSDVVQREIPEPQRRRHLRALADAVTATGARRRHDVLRIVGWLRAAGEPVEPQALIDAARRCIAIDPAQAEVLARLAVDTGGGALAVIALAQHLMFSRRAVEAEELLEEAVADTVAVDDRLDLVVMQANNLTFGLGRGSEGAALLDGVEVPVADARQRNRLLSQSVPMLLFGGDVGQCIARAEAVLDDDQAEPVDRLRVRIALVGATAVTGRPISAIEHASEAFAEIGAGYEELPMAEGQIAAGLILAMQWRGDLDGADRVAQLGYDEGTRRRSDLLRGVSALHLGVGALWSGRVRTAASLLREAVHALQDNDIGLLGWALDNLDAALALASEPEADAAAADFRHGLYETERWRLAGTAAAARSDTRAAIDLCRRAAETAREGGLTTQLVFALFDMVRYGERGGVVDELDQLRESLEGDFLPALIDTAHAYVDDDGDALDRAAEDLAAMGFTLFAAEAARAAALTHARGSLRARAAASDRRAGELAAACEGTSTPLLRVDTRDVADPLTSRERDVAQLAVSGHSNAEIADRLGLSVRTVETHLQRVYTKLGIHTRADLEAFVRF
jgi:DNA-binding CsgD family transcriptional regulator